MQAVSTQTYLSRSAEEFLEQLRELNLVCYASGAFSEMEFDDVNELQDAVKRAMEVCLHAGIPVEGNFRRVYLCSENGIVYDWKLSLLAYRLVCVNGSPSNPNVARMQVELLKARALSSQA